MTNYNKIIIVFPTDKEFTYLTISTFLYGFPNHLLFCSRVSTIINFDNRFCPHFKFISLKINNNDIYIINRNYKFVDKYYIYQCIPTFERNWTLMFRP